MKTKEERKAYYEDNKYRVKAQQKEYREANKEKIKERRKRWNEANKEKIKEQKKLNYELNKEERKRLAKEYRKTNKQKINDKQTEKYHTNKLFKLKCNIKNLIGNSFRGKGYTKKSKTYEILGCSFEELKLHIEAQWGPWMTWDNHGLYNGELGYGWDMDHIICLSTATTEEELTKLNHYTNLQPLCSYTNRYIKIG